MAILKKVLLCFLVALICCGFSASRESQRDIARKLYGRIHIANTWEDYDYKVKLVTSGEDLRVRFSETPNRVGLWKIVDRRGKFNIRFVGDRESYDLKVKFVETNEGSAR